MKKIIFPVLSLALVVIGCGKAIAPYTETPVSTVYGAGILVDSPAICNSASFEFGYEFHTSVTGTITELGCIAPVDSIYRLSLWDVPTQTLLATVNVRPSDTVNFKFASITPVSITLNHDYMVSIGNYNATLGSVPFYFLFNRANPSATILPYAYGDITIDGNFGAFTGATPAFPATATADNLLLPVDIGFQPK